VTSRNTPGAVLVDWGETLVCILGMIHSAGHHLDCVEKMYCEAGGQEHLAPAERYGVGWREFHAAYLAAASRQMARSLETGREHSFEARLADTFASLSAGKPSAAELSELVARLGQYISDEAVVVDGAQKRSRCWPGVTDSASYPTTPMPRSSRARSSASDCSGSFRGSWSLANSAG
jgi:L-rhamnose isomerase